MTFKSFLKKALKIDSRFDDTPLGDFAEDVLRSKKFKNNYKSWEDLERFLSFNKACDGAIEAGKECFELWVSECKPSCVRFDGLTPKNVAQLRAATRKVWSWSNPKKICLERSMHKDGFPRCELCKKKVAKVYVDHIVPVGELDGGYFTRLFIPSTGLQALCKFCHDGKTRDERIVLKLKRDKDIGDFF